MIWVKQFFYLNSPVELVKGLDKQGAGVISKTCLSKLWCATTPQGVEKK